MRDYRILLRLLSYASPYKPLVVLSMATLLVYVATVVATPWIVERAINNAVPPGQSLSGLTFWVIMFFITIAINYVANYAHQVAMARVSQNVLVDLRDDMFAHLQAQSMSYYDREEMGRIMSRIQNDVGQVQEFLTQIAITIADVLTLMAIVAAMLLMDWKLGLITMSVLPVLLFIAGKWQVNSWPRFMRVRRTLAIVNGNLQENISGMRVIQSLNREEENLRQFDKLNNDHLDANLNAGRLSAALMPSVEALSGISTALAIIFGGFMVIDGSLEVGVVVAFTLYIQRFFEPIRNLTMQYTQMQRAMTSGSHIFELMAEPPTVVDKPNAQKMPPIKGEVSFEDVWFSYVPGVEVLKSVNLKIQPGETIAVVGATGAGKTTLASLMLRLYDVTGGRVTIDGIDVREVDRASLVNQIGTVVQEPFLFSGTISDNIKFCHSGISDEQVVRAAQAVGAHDFIMRMKGGFNAIVEERGGNLSAGQRQLIALARALAFDPRIIIMDEATASVDSYTEMLIQEALNTVLKGRTALVIAHRLSTVRNADRIIVMDQGRIVEEGNHGSLLSLGGVYAKLYWKNFSIHTPTPPKNASGNGVEPERRAIQETGPA
jgi:ATP-binding cassette subfamily B protein